MSRATLTALSAFGITSRCPGTLDTPAARASFFDWILSPIAAIEARTEEYREKFANPFVAASRGFIDDVILPRDTRRRLCRALAMLRGKQLANPSKKHDNIPL